MAQSSSQTSAGVPAQAVPSPRPKRYKPWYNLAMTSLPLPGMVSIFHRITGAVLFLLLFLLLYLFDRSLASPEGYATAAGILRNPLAKLVMTGLLWAYCHHFCAGIRYLFLDIDKGVDLPRARASSWAVFAVSILMTLVLGASIVW